MINQQINIKKFTETFPICTSGLFLSLVKPSTNIGIKRILILISAWLFLMPMAIMILPYMLHCAQIKDIENFSKQFIVINIMTIYITKTAIIFTNQKKFGYILEYISNDLSNLNEEEDNIKEMVNESIKVGKICEKIMLLYSVAVGSLYITVSIILSIFSYLFHDEFEMYMVHPIVIRNFEERQHQSPYFEIIWIYQACFCIIVSPTCAGVDASFGIGCAHLSLKLKLVTYRLHEIFKKSSTDEALEENLRAVISDHIEAIKMYNLICEVYQDWLLTVHVLTINTLTLTLYEMSVNDGLNLKFLVVFVCGLIGIYFSCYFASLVDTVGNDMSTQIYKCGWECRGNSKINKMVMFMIAYSQRSITIKARNFLTFNMELFMSILKASYSFYTLIRS